MVLHIAQTLKGEIWTFLLFIVQHQHFFCILIFNFILTIAIKSNLLLIAWWLFFLSSPLWGTEDLAGMETKRMWKRWVESVAITCIVWCELRWMGNSIGSHIDSVFFIAVLHRYARHPSLPHRCRGLLQHQPVPHCVVHLAVQGGVQNTLKSEVPVLFLKNRGMGSEM